MNHIEEAALVRGTKISMIVPETKQMQTFICIDCGKPYELSLDDIKRHYIDKGLSVPKRDPECRKKKKDIDLMAISDLKTLIDLIEERDADKKSIGSFLGLSSNQQTLVDFYDKLSMATQNEIKHNWARIRKLYGAITPSLLRILPHDHKMLEMYIKHPADYKKAVEKR